ncbi:MAG: hypothetical protein LBC09_01995 [Helicobacteraceae bacterium]|jgi:hypothetical protein|nr:hypothetical protein [Helicobacteraceae bacterium]
MSVERSELTFDEVAAKYPDFPRLPLLKIDIQRRGVSYTDAALELFDPAVHQIGGAHIFGNRDGKITGRPEGMWLRDGTSLVVTTAPIEQNPYLIDAIDGNLYAVDQGKPIERVWYWEKPDYYDKTTSGGLAMQNVISARPQRLSLSPYRYCWFWSDEGGGGCKFCDIVNNLKQAKDEIAMPTRLKTADIQETLNEALKERGRYTAICVTGGSDIRGTVPFDDEADYYVKTLRAVGESFNAPKIPIQLICTAMKKDQLKRIYDNTPVSSVTMDIEVLDEEQFNRVCPGKAKWIGYNEMKRRLFDAVEVFGENRVNTGTVGGVELAEPTRFRSEDEALEQYLNEADDLAAHGVSTIHCVWNPNPGSAYAGRRNGSLEYYVRLAQGLQDIRRRRNLLIDFDDYRRCGNHPDTDLARAF